MGNHVLKPDTSEPTALTLPSCRFYISYPFNVTVLESLGWWNTLVPKAVYQFAFQVFPAWWYWLDTFPHFPWQSLNQGCGCQCMKYSGCSTSALVQPLYPTFSKALQNLLITETQETPQAHLIKLRNMMQKKKSFQTTNSNAWCWLLMEQDKNTISFFPFCICNIQEYWKLVKYALAIINGTIFSLVKF